MSPTTTPSVVRWYATLLALRTLARGTPTAAERVRDAVAQLEAVARDVGVARWRHQQQSLLYGEARRLFGVDQWLVPEPKRRDIALNT